MKKGLGKIRKIKKKHIFLSIELCCKYDLEYLVSYLSSCHVFLSTITRILPCLYLHHLNQPVYLASLTRTPAILMLTCSTESPVMVSIACLTLS